VATTIASGDIPRSMALVLGAIRYLAMAKDTRSFHLIVVGKAFLQLINHSIIFKF
jgi:hypothetical protein